MKIWIRTADGERKEIPRHNWPVWQARGAKRVKAPVEGPRHVGGGVYEMPDGSRVRGKDAAGLTD